MLLKPQMIFRPSPLTVALAAFFGAAPALGASEVAPSVEVVSPTPLPGIGIDEKKLPVNVRSVSGEELNRRNSTDLTDLLNQSVGSVHINEVQGNPLQPDVNFRGFTASPLLGTPQGLSVYMDGVRLNQPFGDQVSWDLIPRSAIRSITLMPGSNPLFGLNTLGGALSIQTKDGYSHPGWAFQGTYGSYGRATSEIEYGGSNDRGLNWFATASLFHDDGWRDHSNSNARNLFTKLGWSDDKTDLKLTYAYAKNGLRGNGLQQQDLLKQDYKSVYTHPDITSVQSNFLNLQGTREINDLWSLSGNTYYRKIRTGSFNGDINDDSLDQNIGGTTATANRRQGLRPLPSAVPLFPSAACVENVTARDEPGEKCTGSINRGGLSEENFGLQGQLNYLGDLFGKKNLFTAGAAVDFSRIGYRFSSEYGYLVPGRGVQGTGAFRDGDSGNVDGEPEDARVDLSSRNRSWSLFATDTYSATDRLHLTLSGRYNRLNVNTRDQIAPDQLGVDGDGNPNTTPYSRGDLTEKHVFTRFNPAVGLSFDALPTLNVYGGYSEGNRAPTAIELGCADPDNPCRLPNALAGDPPLKQVVSKTYEAGLRGRSGDMAWSLGAFRTENKDDIVFTATTTSGAGYFQNFGRTLREGIETAFGGSVGRFDYGARYTFVDATYDSAGRFAGGANSTAGISDGERTSIAVQKGDRIPLIPRHIGKIFVDYAISDRLTVGANILAISGSSARGNENGDHQPDGNFFLGKGDSAGYTITNLNARYAVNDRLSTFLRVFNVFDREYYTAAQLGGRGIDDQGGVNARPFGNSGTTTQNGVTVPNEQYTTFYAPGAPRMVFFGIRYELDRPKKSKPYDRD